ncbi:hypothetical protein H6F42_17160 [Pseudanabaena sp. FACHB-1998]|uniref:antibiotic biosynthesis monooxygenase n=1 Tax=Pseudanabaena sp. FACHB-1998 TaxID=2692858 RepID=UPI0016801588|nr:antibiotic biosynthesis monooxygenase [Pseudanabaena sp. FACHB-1998]MBD2178650.1 hypothetical protein [Pseudanabaena sp. FACHB-1998]
MAESQPSLNDPSVTVSISRRVKPECKEEFEVFLTGITKACSQFRGHLGSHIFRPVNSDDPEYRIILKFDRLSNLRHWEASSERQKWFAIAESLTFKPPEIQVLTGLETWFTLSGKPSITPPPRYKMALVTWLAVFPLITLISAILQQELVMLPLVLRVALVTAIAVPTMTYLLMPQMTKLFANWLYPPLDIPSPNSEKSSPILEGVQLATPLPDLRSVTEEIESVNIR